MMTNPTSLEPKTFILVENCLNCEKRPGRWFICDYHSGYDEGVYESNQQMLVTISLVKKLKSALEQQGVDFGDWVDAGELTDKEAKMIMELKVS